MGERSAGKVLAVVALGHLAIDSMHSPISATEPSLTTAAGSGERSAP